jgi:hypothetical protein
MKEKQTISEENRKSIFFIELNLHYMMNKSGVFCKQFYVSAKNKANKYLSQIFFQSNNIKSLNHLNVFLQYFLSGSLMD